MDMSEPVPNPEVELPALFVAALVQSRIRDAIKDIGFASIKQEPLPFGYFAAPPESSFPRLTNAIPLLAGDAGAGGYVHAESTFLVPDILLALKYKDIFRAYIDPAITAHAWRIGLAIEKARAGDQQCSVGLTYCELPYACANTSGRFCMSAIGASDEYFATRVIASHEPSSNAYQFTVDCVYKIEPIAA